MRHGAAPRAPGCFWISSRRIDLRVVSSPTGLPARPAGDENVR
ncbi:hypothetical protein BSLA_01f4030 [Burkholderia stabilis]|nr:hypothetical protein BSLA_01f4030 [Burkholderia stabilis]